MITIITPVIVNLAPIQSVNRAVRPGTTLVAPSTYLAYLLPTPNSGENHMLNTAHTSNPLTNSIYSVPPPTNTNQPPITPKYLPSNRDLPTLHTCQTSLAMWLTANSQSSVMRVRSNLCQAFSNACVLVNHSDEGQLKCL